MKIIKNSKLSKYIRNFLGYKPALTIINSNIKNLSTSDAFFWRTDNNFKTIFRYTDIFKLFFNDPTSKAEIIFYDRNSNFLKKIIFDDLDLSNQLVIDKNFMNNIENYGIFYIFHYSNENNNSIIRNSCYTGYSQSDNLPSFVHGNTVTALRNLNDNQVEFGIGGKTFFKNNIFQIQNSFKNSKVELMIMNPTNQELKIIINDEELRLATCCSIIKKYERIQTIKIISKCYLLRPIVFSYRDKFLDVYHG